MKERERQLGIRDLTEAQFTRYFEVRLGKLRKSGLSTMANCIFHKDTKPSLSVKLDKGVWRCHGCGAKGGVIDMETRFAGNDDAQAAVARIAEIVGAAQLMIGKGPEAIYQYRDPQGKSLFQVVRFPNKRFMQRKQLDDGSWEYKTADLKMVLYNLPEVVMAREVIVVEGEKDADNLMEALELAGQRPRVAVTSSPRGAGKWQDSFAPYFLGKKVIVVQDKDAAGRAHGARVAESVYPFAYGVKLMEVSVGKDVSEFLESGRTVLDFAQEAKQTPQWQPSKGASIYARYQQFEEKAPEQIEWLIEDLAELGSNGMIIARPKGGKSMCTIDLAIALATGQKWLAFSIPRKVKVALVSREDNPATTEHRCRKLRIGRGISVEELNDMLWINTREQSPELLLSNEEEVARLIADTKRVGAEVLILDVMRVLHNAEENDNTEMQVVINALNKIRDQTQATLIVIHHSRKGEDQASLTDMARGASAIAGWCEWIAGISVVETESEQEDHRWVRRMEAELKGAESPPKFYWKIYDHEGASKDGVRLKLMPADYKEPSRKYSAKAAAKGRRVTDEEPARQPGDDDDAAFDPKRF